MDSCAACRRFSGLHCRRYDRRGRVRLLPVEAALSGKGSGRRPQKVTEEEAQANWERIFGKTKQPTGEQPEPKEQDDGE